jgi:hypothetical protein
MKNLGIALVVAVAMGTGTTVINTAQAATTGMSGQLNAAADSLNLVEKTQFFIGSREYCWYDDGWHGPGWYWCGYALRQGFGWGGAVGWHNWDRHHPPSLHGPVHGPVHGPGSSHNPVPFKPGRTKPVRLGVCPGPLSCTPLKNPNAPPPGSHGGGHPTDPNPRPR